MPNSTDIIAQVSRRLRNLTGIAYPNAMLQRLVSQCQRVLNVNQRLTLATVSFVTTPHRTLYLLEEIAADVARVEMVRQDDRSLDEVPWYGLTHQDETWLRRHGNEYEYFSKIGNDLLVIAPAVAQATTVTVLYSTITPNVTGLVNDVPTPSEFVPILQDMIEAMALIRARKLVEGMAPANRVKAAIMGQEPDSIESGGDH